MENQQVGIVLACLVSLAGRRCDGVEGGVRRGLVGCGSGGVEGRPGVAGVGVGVRRRDHLQKCNHARTYRAQSIFGVKGSV